jgi:hypothetical protein
VHVWLRRYAADGGVANLEDRSSRPGSCSHQMDVHVEAKVLTIRDLHPCWGADRIRYQLLDAKQDADDRVTVVVDEAA